MSILDTVRFVDDSERRLIGRRRHLSMAEAPTVCPAMWQDFMAAPPPKERLVEMVSYGVNCQADMAAGRFEYMVAAETPAFVDEDGWDRLILPASRYAVFTHAGPVAQIGNSWQAIFGQWAPTSGHALRETPTFERYGPAYDPVKAEGDTEIWVPIAAVA